MPPFFNTRVTNYKYERFYYLADAIKDFDLICFQELFDMLNYRKSDLIMKSGENNFIDFATSPSPSFTSPGDSDGGLLTLSKFEIVKQDSYTYPVSVDTDSGAAKGIVYTKLNVENTGHFIHVFNTHTQATYAEFKDTYKVNYMVRILQLHQMRQFIEKTLRDQKIYKSDLILLMGDLNIDARDCNIPKTLFNKDDFIWKGFLQGDDYDSIPEMEIMTHYGS